MQSFLIGVIAIIVGAVSGISFPYLLFYSTIVCMQLIEYIVWTMPQWNFYASIAAKMLLGLQPIAAILTMKHNTIAFLSAYCILGIMYQLHHGFHPEEYQMYPGTNGHLVWKWLEDVDGLWIYFFFLLVPFILQGFSYMSIIVGSTLLISLYTYYKTNTWGSMWCWMVHGLVIIECIRQSVNLKA